MLRHLLAVLILPFNVLVTVPALLLWQAGGFHAISEDHGAQRRPGRRFQHDRAACRQRRGDLADRQHQWEVPRADRADRADGRLDGQVPLALDLVRDDPAVAAAGLPGGRRDGS